jgi:hypothetical protein
VWGSGDDDHIFSFCFIGELLNWGLFRDTNELINHCLWKLSISLHRGTAGDHGGQASFTDFKRKVRLFYQETLFIGTPEVTYKALETGISL